MPLPPRIDFDIPTMRGGRLELPDAAALAEIFFATEVSSLGANSLDARTLTTSPSAIDAEDLRVLHRSFRAMIIKRALWEPLYGVEHDWLATLDPAWDLVVMPDDAWSG